MPKRRTGLLLLTALVTAALLAAACSSSKTNTSSGTTVAANKLDPNGTLTYYLDQEPANWNNNNSDANEFDLIQIEDRVWPSVFHIQPDFTVALDKNLMVSATQTSSSPQTIVYKINPKAVWGDGVPITADDFIYNWQAQNGDTSQKDADGKPFNPNSTSGYSQIQSMTQAPGDPYTVTAVFKTPFADWQGLFGSDNPLTPAHIAKKIGFNTGFTDPVTQMVSGGPFEVKSYTKGNSLTIDRNPKYWGPPANLASITWRFITDSTQLAPAVANGEIQAGWPTPQLDQITAFKQVANLNLEFKAGLQFEHLDFNETNKWLKDPAVRGAIMKTVDRKGLIARTVGQIDPTIQPLNDRMFVTNQPGYKDTSGGAYDAPDLTAAKKLLTDGGYTFAADGSLEKGGQKVTLRITSTQGNALRSSEEQYVINQVKQIGITGTEVDTPKLGHTLATGAYDMIIFAWVSTPFPSGNDSLYQTNDGANGGQNFNHFSDPQVDALIKQADNELDQQKRIDLYNQADAILWQKYDTLPLFQRPTLEISLKSFVNIHNNASAEGPAYNAEEWGKKAA